jgi:deazaflavin-dependent oxidoreductase (nitroreductase family)
MRPLGYAPYDEEGDLKYIIVGSQGGREQTPHWCFNLLAHPDAIIEVGGDTLRVKAVLTEGERRQGVLAAIMRRIPAYERYDSMTKRELPVFLLEVQGPEFGPDIW